MQNTSFTFVIIIAGIGIPIMAAMSASLGKHSASPPAATTIVFAVAFLVAATTTLFTGLLATSAAFAAPKHLFLGGVCIAFYALAITFIGPQFGIANAVLCVLLGQMFSSAIIDQFGLFGAPQIRITGVRLLGIALMAGGLYLARSAAPQGTT